MLFKLAFNNMKKSIKDFAIYFLTLVLGVAIFYMFNSLDSQEAMMQVSNSTRELIRTNDTTNGYGISICSNNIRTSNSICK